MEKKSIEGTATISIAQLDAFRQQAEEIEKLHKEKAATGEMLKKLVTRLDDEEYKKMIEVIDNTKNLTDKQLQKKYSEAAATLRVFISAPVLRELVRKYIDEDASDAHYDIRKMTKKEIEAIPILLDEEQQDEQEEED